MAWIKVNAPAWSREPVPVNTDLVQFYVPNDPRTGGTVLYFDKDKPMVCSERPDEIERKIALASSKDKA